MSQFWDTLYSFRRGLVERDREVAKQLSDAYAVAWRGIQDRLDALVLEMKRARDSGEEISVSWLLRQERLKALEGQALEQMRLFGEVAKGQVLTAQGLEAQQAERDAQGLVSAVVPSVVGSWNRLAVGTLNTFVGSTSPGSPFNELFSGFSAQAPQAVRSALLTGLAAGENPNAVARRVRDSVGVALPRAKLIARTEMLRSYRNASLESYRANKEVCEGWIWIASLSRRSCGMCISMHGTRHPVDEEFGSHPACRCTPVPIVSGVQYGKTGEEWFGEQDTETQEAILGKSASMAYRNGEVKLSDFVGVKESEKWGTTRYTKSLKEVNEGAKPPSEDTGNMPKGKSDPQKTSKTVEEIIRTKENEIRGQRFESAFVYDSKGNLVFGKDGAQYEVAFSPEELRLMKGNILTHNHPRGLEYPDTDPRSWGNSFSDVDIALASTHELAEIRAVTPKQRFSMKPPDGGWSQSYWKETLLPALKQTNNEVFNDFLRAVDLRSLSKEEAEARHWHEVWSRLARKLGLRYSQEEF